MYSFINICCIHFSLSEEEPFHFCRPRNGLVQSLERRKPVVLNWGEGEIIIIKPTDKCRTRPCVAIKDWEKSKLYSNINTHKTRHYESRMPHWNKFCKLWFTSAMRTGEVSICIDQYFNSPGIYRFGVWKMLGSQFAFSAIRVSPSRYTGAKEVRINVVESIFGNITRHWLILKADTRASYKILSLFCSTRI